MKHNKESQKFIIYCLMGIILIIVLTITLMASSCSVRRESTNDGTDPMSVDSNLLSNGYPSLAALGEATVKALNDSSAEELYKLMVTEDEFRYAIYPRTPDSLKAGVPWEDAWGWNVRDAEVAVSRKLDRFGGKNLQFFKATVKDTTTVYPGKTTYRNVVLTVDKPDEGKLIDFRFLNVVAMVGGRCKVVAFHK